MTNKIGGGHPAFSGRLTLSPISSGVFIGRSMECLTKTEPAVVSTDYVAVRQLTYSELKRS